MSRPRKRVRSSSPSPPSSPEPVKSKSKSTSSKSKSSNESKSINQSISQSKSKKSSDLQSKSPAEFFAEHQNIAGFDNPGKSLFTTIRELIENSLDAAESINQLPNISIKIEKLDSVTFNGLRGIDQHERKDSTLYQSINQSIKKSRKSAVKPTSDAVIQPVDDLSFESITPINQPTTEASTNQSTDKSTEKSINQSTQYFRVTCSDNGGGMPHSEIPSMLGVVLSSTKYGVKQSRGKFGLGAKMALVWSKKSTGLPITIKTCQSVNQPISECTLDIDIHANKPRVIRHVQVPNLNQFRGTEITVVIEGDWSRYRTHVVRYCRQLAVITPYADLSVEFINQSIPKQSFSLKHSRRTNVMPPPAEEVKHHPSAIDNLRIESLIHASKVKKLGSFLCKELSSINPALAQRLIDELGDPFTFDMNIQSISKQHIHRLTSLLREAKFAPPSADCLSPAGEYNLRLGIYKEFKPELISTYRDEPRVFEGHPFVVEAAVSLGGSINSAPGLTIARYANRIPLLFEPGSDVVSVICNQSINWASYKIKSKQDKIGVFVSLVSTKIPFKGTSKEYIGDDRGVLNESIKKCITQCCISLKKRLASRQLEREKEERKKTLLKYIPDVSRALFIVLQQMHEHGAHIIQKQQKQEKAEDEKSVNQSIDQSINHSDLSKPLIIDPTRVTSSTITIYNQAMDELDTGKLTENTIFSKLKSAVELVNATVVREFVVKQGRKASTSEDCQIGDISQSISQSVNQSTNQSLNTIFTRNLRIKFA